MFVTLRWIGLALICATVAGQADASQPAEEPDIDRPELAIRKDPMPEVPGRLGEILRRYYLEGLGGPEAWQNIKSLRIDGTLTTPEGELQIRAWKKKPNLLKVSVFGESRANSWVMAYDGKQAWMIPPGQKDRTPRVMNEQEARQFAENAKFGSYLLHPFADGKKIEYIDTKPAEGRVCHHIRVSLDSGTRIDYFIDIRTYLEIKVVSTHERTGSVQQVTFDDYIRVDGLPVAKVVTHHKDGEFLSRLAVDRVEPNLGVASWMFHMPEAEEE